jgi:hypothetical protein
MGVVDNSDPILKEGASRFGQDARSNRLEAGSTRFHSKNPASEAVM